MRRHERDEPVRSGTAPDEQAQWLDAVAHAPEPALGTVPARDPHEGEPGAAVVDRRGQAREHVEHAPPRARGAGRVVEHDRRARREARRGAQRHPGPHAGRGGDVARLDDAPARAVDQVGGGIRCGGAPQRGGEPKAGQPDADGHHPDPGLG